MPNLSGSLKLISTPNRRDLDRRFPAGQIQGSVFHRIVAPLPRGDHAPQKGMSWSFDNDVAMSMGPIAIVWGFCLTGYEVILLALDFQGLTHVLTPVRQCLVRYGGALGHRLAPGIVHVLCITSRWIRIQFPHIYLLSTLMDRTMAPKCACHVGDPVSWNTALLHVQHVFKDLLDLANVVSDGFKAA